MAGASVRERAGDLTGAGIYDQMIRRTPEGEGPDPLVPQPLRLRHRR